MRIRKRLLPQGLHYVLLMIGVVCTPLTLMGEVRVGLDELFHQPVLHQLQGKKIGIVTNTQAVNQSGVTALEVLVTSAADYHYEIRAIFAPEHGFDAKKEAAAFIEHSVISEIPVYSLHGKTKRPTEEMLRNIDVLIYDIPCVGSRCYTYEATLFYCIEEAAKQGVKIIVLDRPNPLGGLLVEGPMVTEGFRSFFGHANIPFCHGMTMGELALFFNAEYQIGCDLKIIPMHGWQRSMSFEQTGINWVAPSPRMKAVDTPFFYPATILLGESLEIVSIELYGTDPFKIVMAPWIDAPTFAEYLNTKSGESVHFIPIVKIPDEGKYAGSLCGGVMMEMKDSSAFSPFQLFAILVDALKTLYPKDFGRELQAAMLKGRKKTCEYIMGGKEIFEILLHGEDNFVQTIENVSLNQRNSFIESRKNYLLY